MRLGGHQGAGTLGAALGIAVVVAVLLPSVGVLARLHHATAVTALTTDVARDVAVDPSSWPAARRRLAGALGAGVVVEATMTSSAVHITATGRDNGPRGFARPLVRGVEVRREVTP